MHPRRFFHRLAALSASLALALSSPALALWLRPKKASPRTSVLRGEQLRNRPPAASGLEKEIRPAGGLEERLEDVVVREIDRLQLAGPLASHLKANLEGLLKAYELAEIRTFIRTHVPGKKQDTTARRILHALRQARLLWQASKTTPSARVSRSAGPETSLAHEIVGDHPFPIRLYSGPDRSVSYLGDLEIRLQFPSHGLNLLEDEVGEGTLGTMVSLVLPYLAQPEDDPRLSQAQAFQVLVESSPEELERNLQWAGAPEREGQREGPWKHLIIWERSGGQNRLYHPAQLLQSAIFENIFEGAGTGEGGRVWLDNPELAIQATVDGIRAHFHRLGEKSGWPQARRDEEAQHWVDLILQKAHQDFPRIIRDPSLVFGNWNQWPDFEKTRSLAVLNRGYEALGRYLTPAGLEEVKNSELLIRDRVQFGAARSGGDAYGGALSGSGVLGVWPSDLDNPAPTKPESKSLSPDIQTKPLPSSALLSILTQPQSQPKDHSVQDRSHNEHRQLEWPLTNERSHDQPPQRNGPRIGQEADQGTSLATRELHPVQVYQVPSTPSTVTGLEERSVVVVEAKEVSRRVGLEEILLAMGFPPAELQRINVGGLEEKLARERAA